MSVLDWLAAHAEALGYGEVSSRKAPGNLFAGQMPDFPDRAVAFQASDLGYPGSGRWARVQVMVRDMTERKCTETAQDLAADLDGFEGFLALHGPRASVRLLSGPACLGTDEKRRPLMSLNLRVRYCEEEA